MIDVAAVDTGIAIVIGAVAMVVVVVMTIEVALAMMTTIDAAMAADVTETTAIALETSIATRVVDAMIDMEAVVIAAATVAAIVVVVAIMIAVTIVPLLLPLLATNHANLMQEVVETIAAATIATQVGRLGYHMSTRDRTVLSEPRANDFFRPQTISPPTTRFRFPTCIPRLFTRLDWNLEAA